MSDHEFMTHAISLAKRARDMDEVPVGAVLVCEGKIIGEGFNQSITLNDPTAHAEMLALREAAQTIQNYRLINTTMYVTLEPCSMCVGALIHARISRLVFGAFDLKTGACGGAINLITHEKHNHHIDFSGGVLHNDCAQLLKIFFQSKRERMSLEAT